MSSIPEIREDDAENFRSLCTELDHENNFMMFEPGERNTTVDEQRQKIKEVLSSANGMIFLAEEGDGLIGYPSAIGEAFVGNRHTAYVLIGILERFTGKGIGTALFGRLGGWAKEKGLHRLELTVMVHNERGIGLYQIMGFGKDGIKRHSLLVDGAFVDEYYMSKLI